MDKAKISKFSSESLKNLLNFSLEQRKRMLMTPIIHNSRNGGPLVLEALTTKILTYFQNKSYLKAFRESKICPFRLHVIIICPLQNHGRDGGLLVLEELTTKILSYFQNKSYLKAFIQSKTCPWGMFLTHGGMFPTHGACF